jgi:SAM-dependent methyltransferase
MTSTAGTSNATPTLDEGRAEAFTTQLLAHYTGSFVTFMVDLGTRTGLLEAAAHGPATSAEMARRAGLHERYVREWLGALVTSGVMDYDADTECYTLPLEHAVCLTGESERNMAPLSQISAYLGGFVEPVAEAFRDGGGVPYPAYRPGFTDVMDRLGRMTYDAVLVDGVVPLVSGLGEMLQSGTQVLDVGCGTGHTTNLLAQAFPASRFLGIDIAGDAVERGRAEAADLGLTNVTFEVRDAAALGDDPSHGAVFAFDAIHDQVDPARVLAGIHSSLQPGGVFVMFDINASSRLEQNVGNPVAPWLYSISTLHCLTVSLAAGGAGLGAMWGEETALRMLQEAGFQDLGVQEVPGDPFDSLYVARRSA